MPTEQTTFCHQCQWHLTDAQRRKLWNVDVPALRARARGCIGAWGTEVMAVEKPTLTEEWELVGDGGQTSVIVCEAVCRRVLRSELLSNRRGEQKRPHELQVRASATPVTIITLVEKLS